MSARTVLIAGATGVVGHAALQAFAQDAQTQVIAISRRTPRVPPGVRFQHLPLDLSDARACQAALASQPPITHLVYAALYEKPGLVRGWRDPEQMQTNRSMLDNLLGAVLARPGASLRHLSILQGTKAYGVHLHPVAVPARERQPRDPHENFYWLQEDLVRELARKHGFAFTIWRPQLIFGDVTGVAMNLTPVIGAYAALCREARIPFAYPGGPANLLEATDAHLLARALRWAADAPRARNETFNITNGDVFVWRNLWPVLAQALGVATGPDQPLSLAQFLPTRAEAWAALAARDGLVERDLIALLGESHHYADFCFGFHAREAPPPVIVSTIKLREAGFGECIDTERMFLDGIERLREARILPR